ncbi:hypothetical protein [Thermocrinis sp.]|jgi:hypothetical protein|uniref:hypothetical protein n=1 Tax=Thermocrinis sp. TaxID=2024383 RepID=UPI003BFD4FD7
MKERYTNKRYQREQHPRQQLQPQPQQPPQPQPPQQPQEAKEQRKEGGKWVEVVNLYHQSGESTYKKLSVSVSSDLKVVISLTEGKAKESSTKINFQLSEQELIFLAEKLRHLFFRLGK